MKMTPYTHYQTSQSYEPWPIALDKSLTMIMASFLWMAIVQVLVINKSNAL